MSRSPDAAARPVDAVREVVDARWLVARWARRDFQVRYRQSALGVVWAACQPIVLLVFYGVVFSGVLRVKADVGPYPLFAWCGLVVWTFFSTAINVSAASFLSAQAVITKVYFPKAVVPLAAVTALLMDLTITTTILVVLAATTWHLYASMLCLIPILLAVVLIAAALGCVLSVLSVFVRDVLQAVPLVLQLGFIATPVMYPSSLVPDKYRHWYELNPLAHAIGLIRQCVLEGRAPSLLQLVLPPVVGAVALVLAIRYVKAVEGRIVDIL